MLEIKIVPLQAIDTRVGDEVHRALGGGHSLHYVIEAIDTDSAGNVVHRFGNDTGFCRYKPNESLLVRRDA